MVNDMRMLLFLLFTLFSLSSCSFGPDSSDGYSVYFVSAACNYYQTQNQLSGTLCDQYWMDRQFSFLADCAGVEYHNVLLTQGELDSSFTDISGKCFLTVDNVQKKIQQDSFISELEAQLENLAAAVSSDDILIFHYSGHGLADGSLLLANKIYDADRLISQLDSISCCKLILLDCCYSASNIDEEGSDSRTDFSSLFRPYESKQTRTWYIAAAQEDQLSYSVTLDDSVTGSGNISFGLFSLNVLIRCGLDLGSNGIRPSLPQTGHLTFTWLVNELEKGLYYSGGLSQKFEATDSVRDLVLFSF